MSEKQRLFLESKKGSMWFLMASIDIFRCRKDVECGYYADTSLVKSEY